MAKVQKEIEVILTRQLAGYLTAPVFIVDPEGTLLYYNEPAEWILGTRFEETGEMPASEWATVFTPMDDNDEIIPPEELPLIIALNEHRPAYRRFQIQGLDGVRRTIEVTAFPLDGMAERRLGAVAMFWEADGA
ncbi:MAG TPA: PAS domain-containing protein [Chloroflexota bacterium]